MAAIDNTAKAAWLRARSRGAWIHPVAAVALLAAGVPATTHGGAVGLALGAAALAGSLQAGVARRGARPAGEKWLMWFRATVVVGATAWTTAAVALLSAALDLRALCALVAVATMAATAPSSLAADPALLRAQAMMLMLPVLLAAARVGTVHALGAGVAAAVLLGQSLAGAAVATRAWAATSLSLAKARRERTTLAARTDALARSTAEAERDATRAKADDAEARTLLSTMSFEIRTSMTSVLGYGELMGSSAATEAELDDYMSAVQRNGRYILASITEVLDYSKLEAGRLKAQPTPCALARLLAEVGTTGAIEANEKGLAFDVKMATPIPERILCDGARLRQMILSLVGNAIHRTPRGQVTLTASFRGEDDGNDGTLSIVIVDADHLATANECGRIFEPFASRRIVGGHRTGLTLAVALRLARLLGGSLVAAPRVGGGIAFSFDLRVSNVGRTLLPHTLYRSAPSSSRIRIRRRLEGRTLLLAEDSDDNARLLGMFLRRAGATVDVARNGEEAVCLAEKKAYDVVLTDRQMPIMGGCEAVRVLRRNGYTRPILALTASSDEDERKECIEAGCDGVLSKPIEGSTLVEAVAASMVAFTKVSSRG